MNMARQGEMQLHLLNTICCAFQVSGSNSGNNNGNGNIGSGNGNGNGGDLSSAADAAAACIDQASGTHAPALAKTTAAPVHLLCSAAILLESSGTPREAL